MLKQFKIALFAFVATTGLLTSSCEKVDDVVKADVTLTMSTLTFDIPIITQVGSIVVAQGSTSMDVDAAIKQSAGEKFGVHNIKSLKISSCELSLSNTDGDNNFRALENVKVELSSNAKPEFVTLAEVASNPNVISTKLTIPVNSAIELKDYFSASSFTVRTSGKARRTTSKALTCTATIKYIAEVGL